MSRTAGNTGDSDLFASVADGNTVVAGSDVRLGDVNAARLADMDSVSVNTGFWGPDSELLKRQILAAENVDMEILAVDGGYVPDQSVGNEIKP